MEWQDHIKEEGLIVETSTDILARPREPWVSLANNLLPLQH